MTEAERYLAKAHESLASAEGDVAASRYNSAANRAYYAAFQAAAAALIQCGVRPTGTDWPHRFVMSQFSVTLIRRRKVLPSRYRRTLDDLFQRRVEADYRPADVSRREARDSARRAAELLRDLEAIIGSAGITEPRASYEGRQMTKATTVQTRANQYIEEIKDSILRAFPDSEFEVTERGPKDYRVIVRGSFTDSLDIQDILDGRTNDILVDHDIWIVVLSESTGAEAA